MKGASTSQTRRNDGFHRYLKPGALAQIRDSRINARPNSFLIRSIAQRVRSPAPQNPLMAPPQILTIDQVPDLLNKFYGPCCIRRKKLVAARSFSPMNINPSVSILEAAGGNNGPLNNDAVVAH